MNPRSFRVHVAADTHDWAAWMSAVAVEPNENPHFARVRHIQQIGETILRFQAGGFDWICPGCGRILGGLLADEPVSGWDSPRWAKTGTDERLSLTPSLGCPGWRRDDCEGHWWLRDGMLEMA
jgi:Family of unknown function (DUF6527)